MRTVSCFILAALCLLLTELSLTAQSEGRVGIRTVDGKAEFYLKGSGQSFIPRGFNYIQLVQSPAGFYGESELFLPQSHNEISVDDDFQRMAALGFNAVRVFVDLCRGERCIADEDGLIPEYIQNIASLLERAEQYGLYVMLTANWLPDLGDYSHPAHERCAQSGNFNGGNCLVMSAKGVELYGKFFQDLILGLQQAGAPMETIWAYELRNEFFVEHDQLPFTKNSGMVTTANGKSYNMASSQDRIKMGEDAVVYWADMTRAVIRSIDPQALVTAGFFTPNEPNVLRPGDQRIVPFKAALERSNLDFFGIHAYAGFHDFQLEAENYGIINYRAKPIVLGEYGAFLPDAPDVYTAAQLADHWQADACSYGVQGFTYWTWDRHRLPVSNPDDPWAGSDEGAFITKVLSPLNKVSSCDINLPKLNVAEGKPTSASMSWEGYPSSNVTDGNATQTPWIAGAEPPQWVEVDLQQQYNLETIQIVVETGSDDPFLYTHEIQVRSSSGDNYQTVHTFSDERVNFEVLTYHRTNNELSKVRFVRIRIPQAPGWAALHELRALLPQNREAFDVPPPPILTFPRPGQDEFDGSPLTWKNDVAQLPAQIQIASDPDFQDILVDQSNITDDAFELDDTDLSSTRYWRVRQSNNLGTSTWSVTGKLERSTVPVKEYFSPPVRLYPNPVSKQLQASFGNEWQPQWVGIYTLDGRELIHTSVLGNSLQLDVSTLPPGGYLIKFAGTKQLSWARFVKE